MQFWLPVTKFGTTPVPTNALFGRTVFATFGSVEMIQEMLSYCLIPLVYDISDTLKGVTLTFHLYLSWKTQSRREFVASC